MIDHSHWHVGRSWEDHPLEDTCPCPKEPCGLVALDKVNPDCLQHPPERTKTMRQGHAPDSCPEVPYSYKGVYIPPEIKDSWHSTIADFWRQGVDAAMGRAVTEIDDLLEWDYIDGEAFTEGIRRVKEEIVRWPL